MLQFQPNHPIVKVEGKLYDRVIFFACVTLGYFNELDIILGNLTFGTC